MAMRLFLIYAIVELAVVVALASTIGFGWTVLLLLATFVGGVALAGSQVKRQLRRLQPGFITSTPHGAVADGALVALGTVLVVIPGLASTVLGALLLVPPTRAAARPLVTALAVRGIGGRSLITVTSVGGAAGRPRHQTDYIDGEVVDVVDTEPQHLPRQSE